MSEPNADNPIRPQGASGGDPPAQDRREFFRRSLFKILKPAAEYIEQKLPVHLSVTHDVLRPPGALPEARFLETCYRCGSCSDHCPADAIDLLGGGDERVAGTPFIDPSKRACVLCDDLACMHVCPSGALQLVDRYEIRIGLAKVSDDLCVRTSGEDCRICVDSCPIADVAIRIGESGRVEVIDPVPTGRGCTGCGVCQERCPTRPQRAIVVERYERI